MALKVFTVLLGLTLAAMASEVDLPKSYIEEHNEIRLCGRHLADAFYLICRNSPAQKRSYNQPIIWMKPNSQYALDTNEVRVANFYDWLMHARGTVNKVKRYQDDQPGLSDLCCAQTCNIETIKTFCQF